MRRFGGGVVWATLVAALLAAWAPSAGGFAGFGDVESDRFYTEPVQWMVDNAITTGTSPTCFSPDEPVTRGQAAAFLWRMEGFPAGAPPHPFADVVASWQQQPVSWMYAEGITTGTSPTTYSPDEILTRGQMAALIHRAAGSPAAAATTFPDVVRGWQLVPVGWMETEQITTGTSPATFSPDDPVTRGQFATFAWRWKGRPGVVVGDASPLCGGRDEFDGGPELGWSWLDGDPGARSFTFVPGVLSMVGDASGGAEVFLRDPVADDYEIDTSLFFLPFANFQQAGLTVDQPGGENYIDLIRAFCDLGPPDCDGDAIYLDNVVDGSLESNSFASLPPSTGEVFLRIRHEGGVYTGYYSLDGTTWTIVGSVNRALTDPKVGVWTGSSQSAPVPIAFFDWFQETAL